SGAARRLRASFVDTRDADAGEVAALLRADRPDVVVALGVAEHDAAALEAAGAPVLGVVVAPERPPVWAVRAAAPGEPPPRAFLAAAATEERAKAWAPGSPGAACDRLVALDPLDAVGARLWRTIAPPVDDALFAPVARARRPPRIVFAGPSTEHREWWLATAKHLHDVRHIAHGITPDRLPDILAETDVGLVAHDGERPAFDHRVALHLAAGHLVITEPLHPKHGLEPGLDLLEVAQPEALARVLQAVRDAPDVLRRIRVRGRLKAEQFRASHVWGRVLDDFLRELGG
ncbi:MAG TPA: hypothetical protein VGW10_10550, partial [Solirubrobacteraceae bacterium]|nr:hypothetical protein [Solirubrobacteraceae bacterium]